MSITGSDIPDSEIPTRRVVTPLHAHLIERKAKNLAALFVPRLPLPILARANIAHVRGPIVLSVIGLHYKLALPSCQDKLTIRRDILDKVELTSHQWRRATLALESAGLIRLHHRGKHRAAVTIVDAELLAWFKA
jgi:hypothetical protein